MPETHPIPADRSRSRSLESNAAPFRPTYALSPMKTRFGGILVFALLWFLCVAGGTAAAHAQTSPVITNAPASITRAPGESGDVAAPVPGATSLTTVYQGPPNLTALAVWTPVVLTPTIINADADGDGLVELVSVVLLLGADPADFLRLYVSE